jgi:hypothetical protein
MKRRMDGLRALDLMLGAKQFVLGRCISNTVPFQLSIQLGHFQHRQNLPLAHPSPISTLIFSMKPVTLG